MHSRQGSVSFILVMRLYFRQGFGFCCFVGDELKKKGKQKVNKPTLFQKIFVYGFRSIPNCFVRFSGNNI